VDQRCADGGVLPAGGLEVKRELVLGSLASRQRAAFPVIAALGGMVVPALLFLAFTWQDPVARHGWAIPAATDIAFALGVLALLGSRVPVALKIFLMALAIIDDLGAIVIIALFYTSDLSILSLSVAAGAIAVLALLNIFQCAPHRYLHPGGDGAVDGGAEIRRARHAGWGDRRLLRAA
jgi:NhaA family Na+:H+ antiporter